MATPDDLLKPLDGAKPGGEDLRYAPVYDKLKEARRGSEDWLTEGAAADYGLVIKLGEDLLQKKSKDLQVAVWLAEAYLHKQGFAGFKNGVLLVKGLIEQHWDHVHPELEDGDPGLRLAPLDWMGGTYLDTVIKQIPVSKGGHSYLQYQESQTIGVLPPEEDYSDEAEAQRKRYNKAVEENRVTGDVFQGGFAKTPKQYYVDLVADLQAIIEAIDETSAICEQKFTDEPPSFGRLRQSIEAIALTANSLLNEKRKTEPDEDQEAAEESPAAESAPEEQYEEQTVTVATKKKKPQRAVTGIEPVDEEDCAARLGAIAEWMRGQDRSNPASYMLLRGYRWGELRASGNTAPDVMILLPPPTEVRQQVKKLALESDWGTLVTVGEAAMATPAGRGWLDLQRYMVSALENLGHYPAANAIKSELACLLKDLPDMLNMTLMDDTPVANAETTSWIRESVLPPPPVEAPVEASAPPEQYMPQYEEPEVVPETPSMSEMEQGEPSAPDAFELAREAVRSGNKEQAIEILVREAAGERSGRAKFHRKMQLAQICLSIGRQVIARPILEDLAAEIDKRRLDEWETADVVAHTLALLYRCMDGDNERKQQIYGVICRLDPVQALACLK